MRILWLKTELLHPIDKGGKIRTYEMLRELKKLHHITYLTLDDGTAEPDAVKKSVEYAHEVICIPHQTAPKYSRKFYLELVQNLFSSLPYFMQKYVSPAMKHSIEQLTASQSFDILVCDFLMPSVNVPISLPLPTLLFQHNVEAMIWKRHFEIQENFVKKVFFKNQWQKAVAYEKTASHQYDYVVAVSEVDALQMQQEYDLNAVAAIPTGVDTTYFSPQNLITKDPFNLVFTGSMDWLPNEDAIQWFLDAIFPLIKQKIPEATLTVVGRNPSSQLIEFSTYDTSIMITGRVPDVRPYMEKASVYIVPMRIGSGTRLKIYEAMAMGLPMVSTHVGAEGLPVVEGEDIFLRDSVEDFADMVITLLQDHDLAKRIGDQAAGTVREKFGWQRVAAEFTALCSSAIEIH